MGFTKGKCLIVTDSYRSNQNVNLEMELRVIFHWLSEMK